MAAFGPPASPESRSAIVHDPFDAEAFEEILPRAAGLRLVLADNDTPTARDLAFDLFCSFYKYFVKLYPADRVAPECRKNRDLLARAFELREHQKLRSFTRLKPTEACLATELVLDALLRELGRQGGEPPPATPASEPPEGGEQTGRVETERLREILRGAREDIEGAVDLVAAWSAGPGQETRLPSEQKLRLMRDLVRHPRLRRIAVLFGRYRRLGRRERELRGPLASDDVVDYVQGGDVGRVLASELAALAIDEREDLFYAKLATRNLMIYELWRRREVPRPVYVCLDNSGSMAGEKEVWSKAVALALAHLALDHRRPIEIVLFGDAADPLRIVPIEPEDDGAMRLAKVMDVASFFLGGGTDFVKPLSHVLDAIERRPAKANDLLFVSDGLCPLPEDFVRRFRDAKARHGLRVTTVIIGGEPFSLAGISDSVDRLDAELAAADNVAARFAASFLGRRPAPTPLRPRSGSEGRAEPLVFDNFLPEPGEP